MAATLTAARPTDDDSPLARVEPLLREMNDLKRVRVAGRPGSLVAQGFARSWAALVAGEALARVAEREAAAAVAAVRLAGLDAPTLRANGLAADDALGVLRRGFDAVADALPAASRAPLRAALAVGPESSAPCPAFVERLADQPRAGATCPGRPRVVLLPAENHADHCGMVAVYGVLLAPLFDAEPGPVFLTGLVHHLHNALVPDAGHAGDVLAGDLLAPMLERAREAALAELPAGLADAARDALEPVFRVDTPEARAFQAADVLDRVLQMRWHAEAAGFTLAHALDDLDLVHGGPTQAFQKKVLADAGLA